VILCDASTVNLTFLEREAPMKSKPKLITTLVLAILVIIIIIQNSHNVAFNFFFWHPQISLLLLVVLMVALGFVLGLFVGTRSKSN
jgi:uncharacterized integral membrane protein